MSGTEVHTSFSRSSASRVLNFFCTSLMMRNAVLRLDDGAEISPGSFELELRNVLHQWNKHCSSTCYVPWTMGTMNNRYSEHSAPWTLGTWTLGTVNNRYSEHSAQSTECTNHKLSWVRFNILLNTEQAIAKTRVHHEHWTIDTVSTVYREHCA